ncbi:uncharacterized protein RCC_07889 [Ramularia collo-cygni]|uniref:FAD-binding domain-containing protein n=1 Tax=Ramularia collo-cygni TaxID=112498 RepID=A0A2D3V999_9PEZI|nr:uncharacterized protein RCC_07889 [Ramularia collo-cygni]CZT22020.1 uncharacterized protein RCC_07889 [Ramularia collo-cygni]
MPLRIIIVGAGIAGLAAAVGLARHGHKVQVFERKTTWDETGSGIQLQPNVSKILEEWGMLEEVKKVAHDNEQAALRDHRLGLIAYHDFTQRGPAWYGLRRVLKDLFRQFAAKYNVEIHEGVNIVSINQDRPSIILDGGEEISADLIIGADGSGSLVRQTLFPSFPGRKILDKTVWQISLPLDIVRNDEVLQGLLDGHRNVITVAPARSIFASPSPSQNTYDLQFIDHEYTQAQDPNPAALTERVRDLSWIKERFSDFDPATRKALDLAESAFKWRLVEVFDLPSWSSKNSKVVLLGDACHAMTPYSGQGTAMGLEDAAVLSELLADIQTSDLGSAIEMYQNLRRPRCDKVFNLARAFGTSWSAKDARQIARRNEVWRKAFEDRDRPVKADGNAPPGSPAFGMWLENYNVFEAVRMEKQKRKSKI